jgi:hypothetical protein
LQHPDALSWHAAAVRSAAKRTSVAVRRPIVVTPQVTVQSRSLRAEANDAGRINPSMLGVSPRVEHSLVDLFPHVGLPDTPEFTGPIGSVPAVQPDQHAGSSQMAKVSGLNWHFKLQGARLLFCFRTRCFPQRRRQTVRSHKSGTPIETKHSL